MKTQSLRAWIVALVFALLAVSAFPAWGQAALEDMAVVRIKDVAQTLDIIDEWGAQANQGQPVTLPVRAMLGNTDWIDPAKTAVAMISLDQQAPTVYAIVPFVKTSQVFQQLTQAQIGPGYYLIAYPPSGPVPGDITRALLTESAKTAGQDTISVEIPAAALVAKMESSISQSMLQMQAPQPGAPETISPEDAQLMVKGILDLFKQLQSFGMGVSISRSKAALSFEGQALPGTQLARAMVQPPPGESQLLDYHPTGSILYRSRPYEVKGFMDLMTDTLGPFYAKMGIDFDCLSLPVAEMTGEYVAGISLEADAMKMEGIWCIKEQAAASIIIEKMIQCTVDMTANNPQLSQMPGAAVWKRTKDSKVAGLDVKGMKAEITMPPQGPSAPGGGISNMDIRMAASDGMVFIANTDARLAQVIRKAKALKPGKASGPLLTMEMNLGEIMTLAAQNTPGSKLPDTVPKTKMHITMDMGAGKARTEVAMNPTEIMDMAQLFAKMSPQGQGATGFSRQEGDAVLQPGDDLFKPKYEEVPEYVEPELTPEELLEREVGDLVEKGNLSAMYGGPNAAIKTYKQALKLDPASPAANFAAALAYTELGEFQLALDHTDKALEARPAHPVYLYGRARILLLSGQKDAAMVEFVSAANAGSEDAQNYLDHLSAGQ
ncbi:MAG: tetratricopeptide repeat protein [Desulfatibacillum sp.]|nr:tetratricopeptide repeat protein [Desulfatibacillum sp.]